MSAVIRPLTEGDLAAARRICCTAFGTFWARRSRRISRPTAIMSMAASGRSTLPASPVN